MPRPLLVLRVWLVHRLRIDIHRCPQRGMPHQFLHHFELRADTPEQGRIRVPEGMPANALLNVEGLGDRPNIFPESGCSPPRSPSLVQAAREDPVVMTCKLARLSPGQQRVSPTDVRLATDENGHDWPVMVIMRSWTTCFIGREDSVDPN